MKLTPQETHGLTIFVIINHFYILNRKFKTQESHHNYTNMMALKIKT